MKKKQEPFGRPVELAGLLGDLARAVGGVGELAKAAGVSPRTLQRWAVGKEAGGRDPGGPARIVLAAIAKKHGIRAPFEV